MFDLKKNSVLIGAHNAFTAKLIEKTGFDGVYISGAGLSNSAGVSDTGILKLQDFTYAGRQIVNATKLPVLSDADTGFDNIEKTVKEYIKAGLMGLHIEDQQFPKRCGHLPGKEVVSVEEMLQKVAAAVKVRNKLAPGFLIIARTDARGAVNVAEDLQFNEALNRGKAYLKAGADMIFPESLKSAEEFAEYRKVIDAPLLANMTEFGKTPYIAYQDFFKMGYQMVIFPVSVFRYLAGRTVEALEAIKRDGSQKNLVDKMMPRGEINKLLEYDPTKGGKK